MMNKSQISKLDKNKIHIHGNDRIRMDLFLSFLTIKPKRSLDHLGACNGWTQLTSNNNLLIRGGFLQGIEFLSSLIYKKRLDNGFNDYVNPFHLFDIMNLQGKQFFMEYYKSDIQDLLSKSKSKSDIAKQQYDEQLNFWDNMGIVLDESKN